MMNGKVNTRCYWCDKPILNDESFCDLPIGGVCHINNARPSCLESLQASLERSIDIDDPPELGPRY